MTRFVSIAMAALLSISVAQPLFAAPKRTATVPNPIQLASGKLVKFHIRNDSLRATTMQDGGVQVTVAPGQTAELKLPLGSALVTLDGTAALAPGALVAQVSPMLNGNTLAVR